MNYLLLASLLALAGATVVRQCKPLDGEIKEGITVSACQGPPCRLRRKTNATVSFQFTPESDTPAVINNVHAVIVGIPFPFIGVDGTSACSTIFKEDGKTKASCPLKGGEKYTYRNTFSVLEIYPKIKLVVHWALQDAKSKKNLACFELQAKITS